MKRFSVGISEQLSKELCEFLIREDGDEDLIFALWNSSNGNIRDTSLINELIFPLDNDRDRHGNVSFNPQYIKRVCKIACEKKCGIAFIHSHPFPGWQAMSQDDIIAEKEKLSETVDVLTGFPLIGLTVGSDKTWSARRWLFDEKKMNIKFNGRNL